MSLLIHQRRAFSVVIGFITRHCIMYTHARCIGIGHLANVFCISFRDEVPR